MSKQPVVLMYHGIISENTVIPVGRNVGADIYDVWVDNFRRQMQWLKESGYKVGTDVLITFDDGELNNFTEALPVLQECGFTAYFFIIVSRVGKKGYMGWPELKQLQQAGMTVGSHGLSHEILTNLLDSQLEQELTASKRTLEVNLNTSIETFSVPRGFCNDKVIDMAYQAGYKTIFISDRPQALKAHCISRIAVKNNWTVKYLQSAVKGEFVLGRAVGNGFLRVAKFVLRESGYNWCRSMVLRLSR